ncbi:DUF1559 domain-containing protein [Roseiconus nitratireducens]|uniref:DUF1559 domain-containing protein n=1 Tax=Roseiconus nitratireducens TaxID=2605748 RepID=A0A5M6D445_9BACT|nr:DUF1559 domain-containing protein [Roseiconus nitratireducens]KAA5542287.1 DUF1559 domain-containing protein [Roseiconus nitratireducens]
MKYSNSGSVGRFEVITVLVCLVILAVMGVPWLQAARAEARELLCQDHLRQLGLALQRYEAAHGGFPPRRTGFNNGKPYGGWGGQILPFLEGPESSSSYDPRYDFFDPKNQSAVATRLPQMMCPASPTDRHVEIQSQASTKSLNPDKSSVFRCRAAVSDFITSNGVLMTDGGYGVNAMSGARRIGNQRQPMTDDENLPLSKIVDGLSNTLLLIEQAGRPAAWRNGAKLEGDGQFGVSPNARGAWAGWGSIAFGAVDCDTGERPGRGDSSDCSVNCNNWFGIYSFHRDGAGVLFCDGSVRFVGTELDPITFAHMTVRDDGHLIDLDLVSVEVSP